MPESAPRKVRINLDRNTYFIEFVERKPNAWHLLAQFDARDKNLEFVKEYVRKNPKITLVEE